MRKQTYFSSDVYLFNNLWYQEYQFDDTWPDYSHNVVCGKGKTKLVFSANQLLFKIDL